MPYIGNTPELPLHDSSTNIPSTVDLTKGYEGGPLNPLPFVKPDNPYADKESGGTTSTDTTTQTNHDDQTSSSKSQEQSAEEAYSELIDKLNALNTSSIAPGKDKMKELYDLLYAAEDLFHLHDLDKSVRQNFAEKIYDCAYNLALQQYNNMFNLNSWIVQQSYNSPVEQLRRLNAAGLGGMYSSVASNLAQSAPTGDVGTASQNTGSGQLMQQAKQNKWQNAIGMLQAGVGMATSLVDGYSKITKLPSEIAQIQASTQLATEEANRISTLTPQEFLNFARSRDVMDSQIQVNEANTATANAHRSIIIPAMRDQMENKVAQDWQALAQQEEMFNNRLDWDKEFGRASLGVQSEGQRLLFESAMSGSETEEFYTDSETGARAGVDVGLKGTVNVDGSISYNGRTYRKQTSTHKTRYDSGFKACTTAKTPKEMSDNVKELITEKRNAPSYFGSRFANFVYQGAKSMFGLTHPY